MIKSPDWTVLQQRLDFIVDGRWAEDVILIPWAKGTSIYIPGEEGPDSRRTILQTKGVYVTPGAELVGESGKATGGSGGGFNTQLLEQKCWLSITMKQLGGNMSYWAAYDRVYFPNRDLMYSIEYVEPSATFRPNFQLIRVKDTLVGQGPPSSTLVPTEPDQLWLDLNSLRFYRANDANDSWVKIS